MLYKLVFLVSAANGLMQPDAAAQTPRQPVSLAQQVSYIGVNIQEVTPDRAKALKLPEEAGVEITRVEAESPAEKAGIKAGDVVTDYNGQHVEGIQQFARMVRETPAGRDAKLSIVREGVPQTIIVKVGSRRATPLDSGGFTVVPFPGGFNVPIPDVPRSRMSWRNSTLGIDAESVSGQLAEFFGVKEGVLVRTVTRGLPADRAGIKAGDVIVRVGDSKVTTPADIASRLRGATVSMVVMRDRKEMTVSVPLDDERSGRSSRVEIDGDDF